MCTGTLYRPTYLMPVGTVHSPLHTDKAREYINITHPERVCVSLLCSETNSSLSHFFSLHRVYVWGASLPVTPHFPLPLSLLSCRIAHLLQLPQEDLSKVKGGEADAHRHGPFHPVHTETFVWNHIKAPLNARLNDPVTLQIYFTVYKITPRTHAPPFLCPRMVDSVLHKPDTSDGEFGC